MVVVESPLQIGLVKLDYYPKIVGVVDQFYSLDIIKNSYSEGATLLEFRLDLFDDVPLANVWTYFQQIRDLNLFGIIGTLRESPKNSWIRKQLFQKLMRYVDAIDIETDTILRSELVAMGRACHKKVIISEHCYDHTPDDAGLEAIWESAVCDDPDIVKIATMAYTGQDVIRLMSFCLRHSERPVAAMAMGELGRSTRLMGGLFGSALTYGYLGEAAVAPGQISVKHLGEIVKLL